jgi:peptidoglycan hydrolase-like protein with peptidoglycan-binding domain
MLASTGGNVEEAAAIYNSGQRGEFGTTHHNYGIDVRQRMQFLQRKFGNGSRVQQGTPAWFHRDLGLASPFVKGDDVRVVQKKTGAAPDGVFGPVTQKHVVNFQSHHGRPSRRGRGGRRRRVHAQDARIYRPSGGATVLRRGRRR